jgi:isopenicillin-N N-acyltransferase like protein
MSDHLPLIEARGTHREVGRQIGEAARDLVAQGLAMYQERFLVLAGFGYEDALERAPGYLRPAEDYVPQAVDQLRGLAEGANASFEHLFAFNCSEEFTCAADHVWPPAPPEHCTSVAFMAGERIVSGHNEDWYPEDVEGLVVRKVTLADGAGYLSVGAAYDLPMTGITSRGLTSAANTVYYRDERAGVPNNCLLTIVLQQPDLEHVRDLIAGAPRARGCNHLLCDAGGRIWDIETTAEHWAFIDGGACFAHANHYVSAELSPGDATGSQGSAMRQARAEELLAAGIEAGDEPVALAEAVLSDHANEPLSICGHWDDDDPDEDQSVTTASMVWEPAEGRVHIARGQPCSSEYVTYTL